MLDTVFKAEIKDVSERTFIRVFETKLKREIFVQRYKKAA